MVKLKLPLEELIKEHEHIVKVLKHPEQQKEQQEQQLELQKFKKIKKSLLSRK